MQILARRITRKQIKKVHRSSSSAIKHLSMKWTKSSHLLNLPVRQLKFDKISLVEDLISNTLPETFEIEKGPKVKSDSCQYCKR